MITEKIAKKLVDDLNAGKTQAGMITRSLSDEVVYAKIWQEEPAPEKPVTPIDAYLIRNQEQYLGIVICNDNIFGYIQSSFRKKGIMTNVLIKVILPHLLQQQPLVRLQLQQGSFSTANMFGVAKKLALKTGFSLLQEDAQGCRLMLTAANLKERPYIAGVNEPISIDRLQKLKMKILYAAAVLETVQMEVEIKEGVTARSEELNEYIKTLTKFFE